MGVRVWEVFVWVVGCANNRELRALSPKRVFLTLNLNPYTLEIEFFIDNQLVRTTHDNSALSPRRL